jgi:hypothetical protein
LSYSELVHQVVRESAEPLPFAEIIRRVDALNPIDTNNPKSTIRNIISQSRLIVNTGDGRYGWKYRVINGSFLRLPLSESDLDNRRIIYSEELRDALWPAFLEIQKRNDRSPIQLQLPDGQVVEWTIDFFAKASWGTQSSPEFWDWLRSVNAQSSDDLIIRVMDGAARRYGVEFQSHSEREESTIAERNRQVIEAVLAYNQRSWSGVAIWDVSSFLLATEQYKNPVPPDPLEIIMKDMLVRTDLAYLPDNRAWPHVKKPEIDPLITSLIDQIIENPRSRRSNKGLPPFGRPVEIYQLKVVLQDIYPLIWRRILVQGDVTLPWLHGVLQIVMGWTNSHLHGFKLGGLFFSEPGPDNNWTDVFDERQVHLRQMAPDVGSRFVYEYDFGDTWDHELVVEKIFLPQEKVEVPFCIDGERACPPEDVGGVGGYAEFITAISHPMRPDHSEWMEWIGGKFDPEEFDLKRKNDLLQVFKSEVEKR